MGLTNPGRVLGRFLLRSTSPRFSTLSGIPLFFIYLLRLASLSALLVEFNLSFLTDELTWFFKITKVAPFESVKEFYKDPFLALFFSFLSVISMRTSASCSLYADDLAIWSSLNIVSAAVEATQGAPIRLERWSVDWCLPFDPEQM